MATEGATYIHQLDPTQPPANGPAGEGDDHHRMTKGALRNTLPNVLGPVTASHVELNRITGITGNIMPLLNAKAGLASPAFSGSPTVPTPPLSDNSTRVPNTAWVNSVMISGIPPEVLDTIAQLQQALGTLGTAAFANIGTGAGNVMQVGAFGLGGAALASVDLNTITTSGFRRYAADADHAPAAEAGTLVSAVINANAATQIAASVESDMVWFRRKASGTWQSWVEISGGGGSNVVSQPITLNGGTHNLDLSAARYFYGPLTSNSTVSFQNIPSTGFHDWRLEVQNPSTRTITPSQAITWDGYTAFPPMGSSGRTILGFEVRDYGSTNKIYGYVLRRGAGT